MVGPSAGAEQLALELTSIDLIGVFEKTLSEIGRPTPRREAILQRCYVNANGFEAYHMLPPGRDVELIAHVWLPRSAERTDLPAATDIHDHRWDLASFLVVGQLDMGLHEATAGSTHLHYEHRRDPSWGHRFAPRLPGAVRPTDEVRLEPGMVYSLGREVLHEVRPNAETTSITLMLRGRERRRTTNVFTTVPKPTSVVVRQPRLQPTYICRQMELIAEATTGAGSISIEICR